MHLISARLQKLPGVSKVTMFETTAELLQCIVLQLISPCSNRRLFSALYQMWEVFWNHWHLRSGTCQRSICHIKASWPLLGALGSGISRKKSSSKWWGWNQSLFLYYKRGGTKISIRKCTSSNICQCEKSGSGYQPEWPEPTHHNMQVWPSRHTTC